ncbi:MAG: PEP-CTERM sorting domain-containing protein [Planctomycetota bacterium]
MTRLRPDRRIASAAAATVGAIVGIASLGLVSPAAAADSSAPAILQVFESRWDNNESRAADAFLAGYGSLWVPPPGEAETGGFSVGYDQYDRFDLGRWNDQTLYGTERGVRSMNQTWQRMGGRVYADLVWNHNGFADQGTFGFATSGGYPGFALSLPNAVDGDFHNGFLSIEDSVNEGRLSGLLDIDHETNFQFIRNPVDPNDPRNLPNAGTQFWNGNIANVPTEANRRFYPSQSGPGRTLFDPATNETFTVYDFAGDGSEATTGTPVTENATGYLMRNAQWYVQEIGFDGFRLDAVKHMEPWVLEYFDRAVYGANPRKLLDGSTDHVFSFGEVLDGNKGLLQAYTRKDIDPSQPNRVGGNRDNLDFPLHFALKGNLSSNGFQNDWRNVVGASFDSNDDGLANNGSQGVAFDASHDDFGADLGNVANAYLAMRPGNWVVYHNALQFGENRDFPKQGRGDALGGLYGDTITTLVQARNTHGRGNYLERWIDKETLVYEREGSVIVGLSNRTDSGFDERWVDTGFAPGTRLVELTGNADDTTIDPFDDVPSVVRVRDNGQAPIRIPRNGSHGTGYVYYGLPTPEGTLSIEGSAGTIAGGTATDATNGTTRLADYTVVTADTFTVALDTVTVTLADGFRDFAADGDSALLKVNGGLDVNSNAGVDNVTPGSVAYGFESFTDKSSPLATGGDGEFRQNVDTTMLPEGVNFVEVRAFRQRNDGGPAVYSTFKEVLYVDRLKPESGIFEVVPFSQSGRDFIVESLDNTASEVHVFLNLAPTVDPLDLVNPNSRASQVDRDLFKYGFGGIVEGNNAVTVVTYEITGNVNVQRFGGFSFDTGIGRGLGDLNHNGFFGTDDVANSSYGFEAVLYAQGDRFNPAADINGDGVVDTNDLFLLEDVYRAANANNTGDAVLAAIQRRGNLNEFGGTDAFDIDFLADAILSDTYSWLLDLNADGDVTDSDMDSLLGNVFETVRGDADLNGTVDLADFGILRANFGTDAGWAGGDFDGDGSVSLADFGLLRSSFGFDRETGDRAGSLTFPAALAATVPEPTSLGLLLCGGLMGLRRRRRPAIQAGFSGPSFDRSRLNGGAHS